MSVVQSSRELSGVFQIVATAAPGHTLRELDDVISIELERVSSEELTTDELHRSLTQIETSFVCQLETVGGFGGKSDQLNGYNVVVNDPGYFETDLSRYRNATSATIARISRDHLSNRQRIAVSVVPIGATTLALADSVVAEVS